MLINVKSDIAVNLPLLGSVRLLNYYICTVFFMVLDLWLKKLRAVVMTARYFLVIFAV